MLTATEQKVAKTLGISPEGFAKSKSAGAQAERPALNDQVKSTYHKLALMARGLSLSTNVLLSAAADRALQALDADKDDNLDDDGGVAFRSRNTEHPSTNGLLLNVTAGDRRRVAAGAAVADDYSAPNETGRR